MFTQDIMKPADLFNDIHAYCLVNAFLLRYKDTAPRLIFQYATEKTTPEQKQRFRKEK
jgi:hypothetical protein